MTETEIKQKVTNVLNLIKGLTFTEIRKIIRRVEAAAEYTAVIS